MRLFPYGAPRFAKLVAKVSTGKIHPAVWARLMPYGDEAQLQVSAKVGRPKQLSEKQEKLLKVIRFNAG